MMNMTKTETEMFGTERFQVEVPGMMNEEISTSCFVKLLGLYLYRHLKWNGHLDYLISGLKSVICTVIVLKETEETNLFCQFSVPYGVILWENSSGVNAVFPR